MKGGLDQCETATQERAFWIQDKSWHGLLELTYSGESRCPLLWKNQLLSIKSKGDDEDDEAQVRVVGLVHSL